MFPFSMSFRPQSFGSGIMGSTWANVWKASSPLSHLFLKRANWSKGFGSSQTTVEGQSVKIGPEASCHLGSCYEPYPKHLNVITSLWTSFRRLASDPSCQITSMKCVTPVRSLDIDCVVKPPVGGSGRSGTIAGNLIEKNNTSSESTASATTSNNFFDWFNLSGPAN